MAHLDLQAGKGMYGVVMPGLEQLRGARPVSSRCSMAAISWREYPRDRARRMRRMKGRRRTPERWMDHIPLRGVSKKPAAGFFLRLWPD
jgi:hypothetical protein